MELRASLRDMQFLLFEYLGVEKLCEFEEWSELDTDMFRMTLSEAIKFAGGVLAPLNEAADNEGAKWEDGVVTTPAGFKEAYDQYCENGWAGIHANPEYGGQGFPLTVALACMESVVAANCAFTFTPELTNAAGRVIESYGTDFLKNLCLEKMYTGEWGGTMCLTEPGAGTAVGDLKTKAIPDGDGAYKIEGTKIFITSGDHDMTENIIHLVLARTPDAPSGIKGISLFVVPKMKVDDEGNVLGSNDVQCTGIEHKMGIHGSPTAALAFGENGDCKGWLIGEECKGIVYMFQMMNEARIAVGLQGVALGGQAYETALAYSKERIQGVDVTTFKDPDAPRVPIIKHPDVRRMLMTMKAYSEAGRALLYSTGFMLDNYHATKDENQLNQVELLTPICKAYCSDTGFKVTELGIQVHGGYGYCSEYGMEQLCRDEKIASIYEGANGIQALDLVGRKLGAKGGAVLMSFLNRINTFVAKTKKDEFFGDMAKALEDAKNKLVQVTMGLRAKGAKDPYYPVSFASPYLEMFGEVVFAYFLLDMAVVANEKLQALYADKGADTDEAKAKIRADHPEGTYYWGKIQTAKFFIFQILPGVHAKAMSFASDDTSLMDVEL
jgi:alkylation response protein AidB-like acyl-CoA dehydrogenase